MSDTHIHVYVYPEDIRCDLERLTSILKEARLRLAAAVAAHEREEAMTFATDRALYPVDRTGQLTGGYELPKTMALPKSRWRERRKVVLIAACLLALAVPWWVGLVTIAKWWLR